MEENRWRSRWCARAVCQRLRSLTKIPSPAPPVTVEVLPDNNGAGQPAPEPAAAPQPPTTPARPPGHRLGARCPTGEPTDLPEALPALLLSCGSLKFPTRVASACAAAAQDPRPKIRRQCRSFSNQFRSHAVHNADGSTEAWSPATMSRCCAAAVTQARYFAFRWYGVPDDLLIVDLHRSQPNLKGMRLRAGCRQQGGALLLARGNRARPKPRCAGLRNSLVATPLNSSPASPGVGPGQIAQ